MPPCEPEKVSEQKPQEAEPVVFCRSAFYLVVSTGYKENASVRGSYVTAPPTPRACGYADSSGTRWSRWRVTKGTKFSHFKADYFQGSRCRDRTRISRSELETGV